MLRIRNIVLKCSIISCVVDMENGCLGSFNLEVVLGPDFHYQIINSNCPDNHKMYQRQAIVALYNYYPELNFPETVHSAWF